MKSGYSLSEQITNYTISMRLNTFHIVAGILSLFSFSTCDYVKTRSGQTAYVACGSKSSVKDLQKYNP